MNGLGIDVRIAIRRLRSSPIFTAFSVVTLALGVGATTAIYSVIYAAVLRPPDIKDVDRVANLYHMDPRRGASGPMMWLSAPDFTDYRTAQTSFSRVAAWARFRKAIVAPGLAEVVMGEMVGGDYFAVVGVERAARGRLIQPSDDRVDAPRVIVLSDLLWKRRFGGDPDVVGRRITVGGEPFEIIGVAPSGFRGVDMPNVTPTPAWVPLSSMPEIRTRVERDSRWLSVKGRLKPGVTIEQAQAEARTIAGQLDAAYPLGQDLPRAYRMPYAVSRPWFVMPASEVRMHESTDMIVRPLAAAVMLAVVLVLLVACTNVANLMLARASARRHEIAVRLALGASRLQIVRERLVETALIAVAGGTIGLVIARLLMRYALAATMTVGPGLSVSFRPEMNVQVLLAAAAATGLALIVFGLIPALQVARAGLRDSLASDSPGTPLPRWRGRRHLIALQVTVSAGLVAVAVLCVEQVFAAAKHDSGLDLDRLAVVHVDFRLQAKDEVYGRQALEDALRVARGQPGVEAVALSSGLPVGTGTPGATVDSHIEKTTDGMLTGSKVQYVEYLASTPDVFRVLGVRILQGRAFDERDSRAAETVVVLSRSLARGMFGDAPAVGRHLVLQRRRFVGEETPAIGSATVVGVAEDTDVGTVGRRSRGVIYVPFAQRYEGAMSILAKTSGDPTPVVERLRRAITADNPELAIFDAGTGITIGGAENLVLKIGGGVSAALGGLALMLAMVGLYGVLTDIVQGRTREIGLRLALGADRAQLTRMVVSDGLRPVLWGLVLGTGVGVLLRLAFRPLFLVLLPAFDPIVFLVVPLPFLGAALLAAYFPARRAARVDPNVALRHL